MSKPIDSALPEEIAHSLREGLTLSRGWLELVFRRWDSLHDAERRQMVAAALLGTYRAAAVVDGDDPAEIPLPHEKLADEFMGLAEKQ